MKKISLALGLVLLLTLVAVSVDSDRKYIVLRRDAAKNAPFSEAVLVGNTLYIAGHLGIDPKTGKPGTTPEEEARLVMESLKRTVEESGFNMDDIVSVQVFCSDVSVFDAFNSVYRTYFHGNYPARAFIGAGKLLFGARFEVQGIAVKR
jgi:2-iminobutanoate/2-iminopropanoate deaminase